MVRTSESVFRSAGLVARYDRKKALKLAEDLAEYLGSKGLDVFMEDTLAGKVNRKYELMSLERMKTDFVITIGGDGTILRTCLALPKPEPPILAINMGVRGFLAESTPKDAFNTVDKCLRGECYFENLAKLSIVACGEELPDALNEVVISPGEPGKLLYARITKNGDQILDCQADGLMTATQAGSTGYSLSAGGPVLDTKLSAIVLTPICALTDFRSIVFPSTTRLTIEALKPRKVLVMIDGHYRKVFGGRTLVTATGSRNKTCFIRSKDNFYHRLKSRLLFRG